MCGIAGYISLYDPVDAGILGRMATECRHRGPDDSGIFVSEDKRAGLAHRRLSFLDLSSTGHQPMGDAESNLSVTFNGEIYNYLELRAELESQGYRFRTQTDTEVLLHGYHAWGSKLPCRLEGMFAFAIYDDKEKSLFLARDRFGIKPLYYFKDDNRFIFGSEIKSLFTTGFIPKEVRPESVSLFLANRYVPAPLTIWKNIHKLRPGHSLTVDLTRFSIAENRYWQLPVENNRMSRDEASATFHQLLKSSLSHHLRSDVPVGAFLSGGYDSSALVYLMRKELNYPTDAFTIGFRGWDQSEDQYARMVAEATGAVLHTAMPESISLESVRNLMWHYDDPIADISIIPTYEVSRLAAANVKAVVSGEGADEALAGYWWHKPEKFRYRSGLYKLKSAFARPSFEEIKQHYIHAMSMGFFDRNELKNALTGIYAADVPDDPFCHFDNFRLDNAPPVKQLQYLDAHTFMPELILAKVDRASMAHSLEVRVPFLDPALMTFLFGLSPKSYIGPGVQKIFLRDLLQGHVPQAILDRPKQGFVGPDKYYMDYTLYETTLANGRLVAEGVIRDGYPTELVRQRDHWKLWKLFVLENWWQVWM